MDSNQIQKDLDEILELSSEKARDVEEATKRGVETTNTHDLPTDVETEAAGLKRSRSHTSLREISEHYIATHGLLDEDDSALYEAVENSAERSMLANRAYRPEEEDSNGAAGVDKNQNESQLRHETGSSAHVDSPLSYYNDHDQRVDRASHPDPSKLHTHRAHPSESYQKEKPFYDDQGKMIEFEPAHEKVINSLTVDHQTTLHADQCDPKVGVGSAHHTSTDPNGNKPKVFPMLPEINKSPTESEVKGMVFGYQRKPKFENKTQQHDEPPRSKNLQGPSVERSHPMPSHQTPHHGQTQDHTYRDCQMDIFCEKPISTSQRELRAWHEAEHPPETDGELYDYLGDPWHGKSHYAPVRNPSETNLMKFVDQKLRQSVTGHPYEIQAKRSVQLAPQGSMSQVKYFNDETASASSSAQPSGERLAHSYRDCQMDIFCEKPKSTSDRDLVAHQLERKQSAASISRVSSAASNQKLAHSYRDCQMDIFCEKPMSTSQRELRSWHVTEHPPETDAELNEYLGDPWHGKSHYAPVRNPARIVDSEMHIKTFVDKKLRESVTGHPHETAAQPPHHPEHVKLKGKLKAAVFGFAPAADYVDDETEEPEDDEEGYPVSRKVSIKEMHQTDGHRYSQCQWDIFCEKPMSTSERELRFWQRTEHPLEADDELNEYRGDAWHGKTHHVPVRNPMHIQDTDGAINVFVDRKLRQSISGHPYENAAKKSNRQVSQGAISKQLQHDESRTSRGSEALHYPSEQQLVHTYRECQMDVFCEKPHSTSERELVYRQAELEKSRRDQHNRPMEYSQRQQQDRYAMERQAMENERRANMERAHREQQDYERYQRESERARHTVGSPPQGRPFDHYPPATFSSVERKVFEQHRPFQPDDVRPPQNPKSLGDIYFSPSTGVMVHQPHRRINEEVPSEDVMAVAMKEATTVGLDGEPRICKCKLQKNMEKHKSGAVVVNEEVSYRKRMMMRVQPNSSETLKRDDSFPKSKSFLARLKNALRKRNSEE